MVYGCTFKDIIDLHLKNPLSLPRNSDLFPENREIVGGFIFKSLAKYGLLVTSEEFQYQKVSAVDHSEVSQRVTSRYILDGK